MNSKKTPVFFDFASATPALDSVVDAMKPYWQEAFYNPSALYLSAHAVNAKMQDFRHSIAKCLQVRASEVYFAAGSTEANNTVIHGVLTQYKDTHVVVSAIEHDSVINSVKEYNYSLAGVTKAGLLDIESVKNNIRDNTVLISCMHANNEIGTVQPIADLVKLVQQIKQDRLTKNNTTPLFVHVDASQSFNYLHVLPHQQGIDFAVIGGSKIYGPKQTAVLYIKAGITIKPLVYGGGQEHGLRSGTENVAGIAGLAVAINAAEADRSAESERLLKLQKLLIQAVQKLGGTINGSLAHRLPNNVHVTFNGVDNETLVMRLDQLGFMIATGSACSASSDEPSHVLRALGLSDQAAQNSVRITMGRSTTQANVDALIVAITSCLHR